MNWDSFLLLGFLRNLLRLHPALLRLHHLLGLGNFLHNLTFSDLSFGNILRNLWFLTARLRLLSCNIRFLCRHLLSLRVGNSGLLLQLLGCGFLLLLDPRLLLDGHLEATRAALACLGPRNELAILDHLLG